MDSHREEIQSLLNHAMSRDEDDVQIVYLYKKIKELGLKDKLWSMREVLPRAGGVHRKNRGGS